MNQVGVALILAVCLLVATTAHGHSGFNCYGVECPSRTAACNRKETITSDRRKRIEIQCKNIFGQVLDTITKIENSPGDGGLVGAEPYGENDA